MKNLKTTTFLTHSQFTDGSAHEGELDVMLPFEINDGNLQTVLSELSKNTKRDLLKNYNKKDITFQLFSHRELGGTVIIGVHPRDWDKHSQKVWDELSADIGQDIPNYKTLVKGSKHIK